MIRGLFPVPVTYGTATIGELNAWTFEENAASVREDYGFVSSR